jgi:phosphoribosyl-AMP cyclohydrolase
MGGGSSPDGSQRNAGNPMENPGLPPQIDFDKFGGLITAVVQDAQSLEVRMVGFMDREAWERTLETGYAHYYSRSRSRLWKKGETSGHVQQVREIRVDCDQDAVVLLVRQEGDVTCHTGNRSCFYRKIEDGRLVHVDER